MELKINDYINSYLQSAEGYDLQVARHLKEIIPQTTHLDERILKEIIPELDGMPEVVHDNMQLVDVLEDIEFLED